jgi:nuclear pore complex protein Nup133
LLFFSAGVDAQHDMEELQQRFNILRPEILETLSKSSFNLCRIHLLPVLPGRCGYEESAYGLAERYQDFDTLVALCHKDTVYPPGENPHAARIQSYIQRFKDNFTTALFQWYIQHG